MVTGAPLSELECFRTTVARLSGRHGPERCYVPFTGNHVKSSVVILPCPPSMVTVAAWCFVHVMDAGARGRMQDSVPCCFVLVFSVVLR